MIKVWLLIAQCESYGDQSKAIFTIWKCFASGGCVFLIWPLREYMHALRRKPVLYVPVQCPVFGLFKIELCVLGTLSYPFVIVVLSFVLIHYNVTTYDHVQYPQDDTYSTLTLSVNKMTRRKIEHNISHGSSFLESINRNSEKTEETYICVSLLEVLLSLIGFCHLLIIDW